MSRIVESFPSSDQRVSDLGDVVILRKGLPGVVGNRSNTDERFIEP